MRRCIECANSVHDTDQACTACRLHEWKQSQQQVEAIRQRANALEAHRWAYTARRRAVRESINKGIAFAVLALLGYLFLANLPAALRYETTTKPAQLKAHGVK